ncbi:MULTISPECIES: LacI family DNA-binding transcriptional regulator [unclassified Schaalia]|uniref:LacI family DNA-binding transcriptional regulator n=1 Tax=unclassified Schaalia TaxID=2691889 RepID=UPI001E5F1F94|nr:MULTISPECIES: LacI family DNA-binding transcriptional regulator [unclassified Schaalia]MCD4550316.1 LacI family transcriptional regulator [Schaalia sp. lx-260]MCD4557778.1 LacI family transcriptional regulator [Schaalia sp. lx-100]
MNQLSSKRVSQADVARIAGVSVNTVSRVVRDDPEVAESTRKRIQAVLHEVGYRPNYAARSLVSKRTGVLHVTLAAPMFHGHARVLLSVMNAAAAAGFHVSVSNAWGQGNRDPHEIAPFDVDGVVILGGQEPTVDMALRCGKSVPTVLLLSSEQGLDGVGTVIVDNVKGSYLATKHLLHQGERDILYLEGPRSWSDALKRRQGFDEACQEWGIEGRIVSSDSWNAREGYDAMLSVLDLPSALACSNDQLAMGAMCALQERGVSIPNDIRVVGFDDMDGSECFFPPLTTIRQPFDRVGGSAVRQIRQMLDGSPPQDISLEPELVIRSSSVRK